MPPAASAALAAWPPAPSCEARPASHALAQPVTSAMDTPRDNLRTSPGLDDLELELDAPLLPRRLPGSPAAPEDGGSLPLQRAAHEARRCVVGTVCACSISSALRPAASPNHETPICFLLSPLAASWASARRWSWRSC